MIVRTFDDDLINSFIGNDPEFCLIRNAKDYPQLYFLHEPGVAMFPSIYANGEMNVHACVIHWARGKKAIDAGRKGFDWIFKNTDVEKITTQVRTSNRQARMYAAHLMNRVGELDGWIYYEVKRWADSSER